MSTARERILGRVRAALTPLPARAPMPAWEESSLRSSTAPGAADLAEKLAERLRAAGGDWIGGPAALAPWLLSGGWTRGYCDPRLLPLFPELGGAPFQVETSFERSRLDDYTFGITRASGAIAETGTLVLEEGGTPSRLGALAPWVHVAVLHRADISADLSAAVARLSQDPNTIWVTGPSKTADVEGILIQGVHGPGRQACVLLG